MGNTPVDIAGFCAHADVVIEFCKHLETEIKSEQARSMNRSASPMVDEEGLNHSSNQVAPLFSGTI